MLAYVFWHWRYPEIDGETYQSRLMAFHRVLTEQKPAGFQYSVVFCSAGAPWIPTALETYEDWYLVDGAAALDPLNEAAVSGPRRAPHDEVARGAAGLYRFRTGELSIADAQFALWFSKPAGASYDDFYASVRPWTSQLGVGLWGRQMVLGPTPEFCLLTPAPVKLPERFNRFGRAIERLWPGK
jgi:hypothetical protein